jgi:hypothetical protein
MPSVAHKSFMLSVDMLNAVVPFNSNRKGTNATTVPYYVHNINVLSNYFVS